MEKRDQVQLGRDTIFGTRAVIESIQSGQSMDKVMVQRGLNNPLLKELMGLSRSHGIPVVRVPIEKLNRITRKNHQGVIAQVSSVTYSSLENVIMACFERGELPCILILDRVTDVRNFGAIARSAECAGVHALVIPSRGSASINSDAMKTSAGALNYIPVCREDNLKETIKYLKDAGLQVVSCTEKAEKTIYEADLKNPVALIMGSEEDGISPEYLKLSDEMAKVPITGNIQSLNVSVAAGLMVYEVVRQRS